MCILMSSMSFLRQLFGFIKDFYGPVYADSLVTLLKAKRYNDVAFIVTYWQMNDFSRLPRKQLDFRLRDRVLSFFISLGMLLQIVVAATLIFVGIKDNIAGWVPFGLAVYIAYPLVWAHIFATIVIIYELFAVLLHPRRIGKSIICYILEMQVKRLRHKNDFLVIAVTGSIGKTSTKMAIARTLGVSRRVLYQKGNYNDRLTVPLVFFERTLPGLYNLSAWLRIFISNERTIRREYPYDAVVVELGTDGPGQIKDFAYLQPDISIVTAITPEHMEYFKTLDAVAVEELAVADFSKLTIVNADDTPEKYLENVRVTTYGTSSDADYEASGYKRNGLSPGTANIRLDGRVTIPAKVMILGDQGVKFALAAAATAHKAGLSPGEIKAGLEHVRPFAGRMQILDGIRGATLIDDTYNATPIAVTAALDVLYATNAPQRIAILGSMNELGDYSPEAHKTVGAYCDSKKLDLVVTIGKDAKEFLAPAAESNGCKVVTCMSPCEAGSVVKQQLRERAVVLAKGSQNGVFAEEALKELLAYKTDENKLVRQSPGWLKTKRKQFPRKVC